MYLKIIQVSKISIESYNKLVAAGYEVQLVNCATEQTPFVKYKYRRPVNVKRRVSK